MSSSTTSTVVTSLSPRVDPVTRARALGAAIEAAGDEIERTQEIPEPLLTQIHESRLWRMLLPRSVGGDQLEPWVYLHAIEELGRHDGSVAWCLSIANSTAVISWGPPNQHRAIAVPGGYRVSGEWHFSSGRRQANWIGAHCQVVEPDGSLRKSR